MRQRFRVRFDAYRGRIGRSLLAISSGTAASQVALALGLVIAARIYEPAEFGLYSYLASIAGLISIAATLRLEYVIPIEEDDTRVDALTGAAVTTGFTLSFIFAGAAYPFLILNDEAVHGCLVVTLLATLAFAMASTSITDQRLVRARMYGLLGVRTVVQSSLLVAFQILLGLLGAKWIGLSLGEALGRFAAVAVVTARGLRFVVVRPRRVLWAVSEYHRTCLQMVPMALVNAAVAAIPLVILTRQFGPEPAGQFGMALRIAYAPSLLLGIAISQVFMGELSQLSRGGEMKWVKVYLHASRLLIMPGLGILLILLFIPGSVMTLVLGSEWAPVPLYMHAMAFGVSLGFVLNPLSQVFILSRRFGTALLVEVSRACILLLAAYVGIRMNLDAPTLVLAMYCSLGIHYSVTWALGLSVSRVEDKGRRPSDSEEHR